MHEEAYHYYWVLRFGLYYSDDDFVAIGRTIHVLRESSTTLCFFVPNKFIIVINIIKLSIHWSLLDFLPSYIWVYAYGGKSEEHTSIRVKKSLKRNKNKKRKRNKRFTIIPQASTTKFHFQQLAIK